jgi:3-oxoadipate enol-lactonase
MAIANLGEIALHYRIDGNPDGAPVVFANALGTDLRLWDQIIPLLPQGLKYIRYDKRGHGLSSCPKPPYSMGMLVTDAERLLDHLSVRDCVFVGLSIGGMIAQGLAVKRLDQVRAVVLSNTAAKIGTKEQWAERIQTVRSDGIESLADPILERWFSKRYRQTDAATACRNMFLGQPVDGYIGCCQAISGTDFYTPTASLTLPALGIAGTEDKSTPPDLVRETIELIKGSEFQLIRGGGHLPCLDKPEDYAAILTRFLTAQGLV